jgi:hypothetical protein
MLHVIEVLLMLFAPRGKAANTAWTIFDLFRVFTDFGRR